MNAHQDWESRPIAGRRTSAVGYVLADLREAIETGVFGVGERLPSETALAERYGVSRTVVREVLRSCESAGLTVTRPGRGSFVVSPRSPELVFEGYSATQLMEARPAIEIPAAGLAALRRTDDQLGEIRRLGEAMAEAVDDTEWTRLDARFHLAIAQASANPVFADVLASIAAALRRQSQLLNVQLDRRTDSVREHRAVIAALVRGSATEAEDAMRFHLEEVRDAMARMLTRHHQ
ncbi:MAG: FadR/GntR family transcriptional regulator [Nocardioides sp.]|uniref:FadR/GntR family transcriptional regulator n=1 Tax=Nocardioides sp. TaxID=35761 RepID=UPI0039E5DBEF